MLSATNSRTEFKLCRDYLVGKCSKRNKCPYFHPNTLLVPANTGGTALFKSLAYKTTPCKHFVRTKGWCPMGEACHFIHDLNLSLKDEQESQGNEKSRKRGHHCWAFVQGFCRFRSCPYRHPKNPEAYIKYTPCPSWPNCTMVLCPFRHPELNIPRSTQIPETRSQYPTFSPPTNPVVLSPPPPVFVPTMSYPALAADRAPLSSYSTSMTHHIPPPVLNNQVTTRAAAPTPYTPYERNGTIWFNNTHSPDAPPSHSLVQSQWNGGNSYLSPGPQGSAVWSLPDIDLQDSFPSTSSNALAESNRRVTQYNGLQDRSCVSAGEGTVACQPTVLALGVDGSGLFPFKAKKKGAHTLSSKNERVSISIKPQLSSNGLQLDSVSQVVDHSNKRKSWSAFSFLDRHEE